MDDRDGGGGFGYDADVRRGPEGVSGGGTVGDFRCHGEYSHRRRTVGRPCRQGGGRLEFVDQR